MSIGLLALALANPAAAQHPPLPGPPSGMPQPDEAPSLVAGGEESAAPGIAGDGLMYVGTYQGSIYVIDEAMEEVVDQIPLETGIPRSLELAASGERFYVRDVSYERVEVVDIASRETLDVFTLSSDDEKVRIWGMTVAPDEDYAILVARSYRQLPDRFEIGEMRLLQYDLERHQIMRELPWPDDEPRERLGMRFSQDGELLYVFLDGIRVYETEQFEEVDRWDYSDTMGGGTEDFSFGFPDTPFAEPGTHVGLFRVTDPVHDRRLVGVARADLDGRRIDATVIGPDTSGLRFSMAPGGSTGYVLTNDVNDYQFWTIDLEAGRVLSRQRFAGRPRMALQSSSSGEVLYIYNAGNTIDLYRADDYSYMRTIVLDADTTTSLFILPRSPDPSGGS